jgi:hypothetical protein
MTLERGFLIRGERAVQVIGELDFDVSAIHKTGASSQEAVARMPSQKPTVRTPKEVFSWLLATGCWLLLLTFASAVHAPVRRGRDLNGISPCLPARSILERFPDILTLPDPAR